MPVKTPLIARQQPAFDDRLRRLFRVIQIMRHDRAAPHCDFANPAAIRIQHTHLGPAQRLAHGVGAKRFQIVKRHCRASFRQPVPASYRNSNIVEELQRRRIRKCSTNNQRPQFSAKRLVYLWQQTPAQFRMRTSSRQHFVQSDQTIQHPPLSGLQLIKLRA